MTSNAIRQQLKGITEEFCSLIYDIPVEKSQNELGMFQLNRPEYCWGNLLSDQKSIQINLKKKYEEISELLKLFFKKAPNNIEYQLKKTDESFRIWLELGSNWSITPNKDMMASKLKNIFQEFESILDILESNENPNIILIPDTNALIREVDPHKYFDLVSSKEFTFFLLPTVFEELDKLKILHQNQNIRDKAKKIIKRIKGWRNQGSLSEGVTVNSTITVKAEHKEPDMKNTLSWLNAKSSDDRIIASVLSVMLDNPSSRVILVTGDINLQNKADAATIEVVDI